MKADDCGRQNVRQPEQRLPDGFTDITVDGNSSQRLTSLSKPSLMILGDVHACLTKERPDSADYAGNIVIRKDQQRIPWLDVYVESADPRQPWGGARLCRTCNRDFLHPPAQPHFDSIRVVLSWCLRGRQFNTARFRYSAGIDKIETLLFHGSLQNTARGRRHERTSRPS
jgi:hypothetical protein